MRPIEEQELFQLYRLMEEETAVYHLLLEAVEGESESLRALSPEDLLSSLGSIDAHVRKISGLEEGIHRVLGDILTGDEKAAAGRSVEDLCSLLPQRGRARVKGYQRTLRHLKDRVERVNRQNRVFIEDSLVYFKDLFSCLMEPLKGGEVYAPTGQKRALLAPSCSFSRKVG